MAVQQLQNVMRQIRLLADVRTCDDLPDAELLARFVARQDEVAFTALVERHGQMVFHVCLRVLRHMQNAEDACQATFLVLLRRARSIRQRSSVGSWLHGTAYHVASKLRAELKRRRATPLVLEDLAQADDNREAHWRELPGVLDEELKSLPELYRAPLEVCYLEGMTRDEAGQRLGWNVDILRGRLERGRARLRNGLRRRGIGLSLALLAQVALNPSTSAECSALRVVNTVRAAMACLGGQEPAAGSITPQAASLTRGVLQTMLRTRMKMLGAFIVGVLLASTGAGLVTYRLLARETNYGLLARQAEGEKGKGAGRDGNERAQPGKEAKQAVSLWQRIDIQTMHIGYAGEKPDQVPIGLKVGTFDLKKWLATNPSRLNQLPTLKAASAADPLYATVLGPMLNSGESMTFAGVEWRKNQAVIHVKVWRDSILRKKNWPFYPLLVVSLQRPALKGEFRVEVDWTLLRAPREGELYASGDAPEELKVLRQKSSVSFQIK